MKKKVVIVGAGPAGLGAAYEFIMKKKLADFEISIFEADSQVGGIAKTLSYKGYRFDLGGHRFYTKYPEIDKFYQSFLGKNMLTRKRLSRIYFDKKLFIYPLSASNALKNLGLTRSIEITLSWLFRQFHKHNKEEKFDEWVSNRFGDKLFNIFFKSYTEKVWGIPTSEISAQWAAQRIQNFSLPKAIINALFGINPGTKTIIKNFLYPKYGPGMLYEKMKEDLKKQGIKIFLDHKVIGIKRNDSKILSIGIEDKKQNKQVLGNIDYLISTMPFNELILCLNPQDALRKKIKNLKFRNFIAVNLIVKSNPFPDQWIYIHEPNVKVGRIQNFRNWSPYMVKIHENNTPISMEYFASQNDPLWETSDNNLLELAKNEIVKLGLVKKDDIVDGFVCKVKNAYPVYDYNYEKILKVGKEFLRRFNNVYLCGRGGLFRYNNQDHSILSGFYTARNIISGTNVHDVWNINEGEDYIETK